MVNVGRILFSIILVVVRKNIAIGNCIELTSKTIAVVPLLGLKNIVL